MRAYMVLARGASEHVRVIWWLAAQILPVEEDVPLESLSTLVQAPFSTAQPAQQFSKFMVQILEVELHARLRCLGWAGLSQLCWA